MALVTGPVVVNERLIGSLSILFSLEEMEADYTLVSNGQEAIDAVYEENYELIIMDCLMPVMDGKRQALFVI